MEAIFVFFALLFLSPSVNSAQSFNKIPMPSKRIGPEAFAFDASGKVFYTSISGGKIIKYGGPQVGFTDFAYTSESANETICTGIISIPFAGKCGRPAGIAFGKNRELYIADAPLGLFVAPPSGGIATKLADSASGKPFKFLDGLDVDPTTGVVYFTSFSSKFKPAAVLAAVVAKDATGKLFKYDPATKNVTVLLEGLSGSAGCAVSSDGSYVLTTEFIKNQIVKYWIKGEKAGKSEIFVPSIPGPDNIKRTASGNFWVASVVTKIAVPTNPSAVKIDSNGKIVQTIPLKDSLGNVLLSEVNEVEGSLYLGSLTLDFAGLYKI